MLYAREDFEYVKDTFGQTYADLMMFHRRDEEIPSIQKRIDIRKKADTFAHRGYRIEVKLNSTVGVATVLITGPKPTDRRLLTGNKAFLLVNDAINIRDGAHSKIIPLRLADVLFYYLPQDTWN